MNGRGRKKRRLSLTARAGLLALVGLPVNYKLDFNATAHTMTASPGSVAETGMGAALLYAVQEYQGYFVSPSGSATGAGTFADPWTLKQACLGGYPTNSIQPGDTVWVRGGTYTAPLTPMSSYGQFSCQLNGTAGNFITFRPYPGEHPKIDGNYDNGVTGNCHDTIAIEGQYQRWRQLEVMNSQTNRVCGQGGAPPDARGDGFGLRGRYSEIINNVVHDTGEGMGIWGPGRAGKVYGNLNYHNGFYQPNMDSGCENEIDLAPAAGVAVAATGSPASSYQYTGSSLTFSFNNTGDCVVVGAAISWVTSDYTNITATYAGVTMNRINGENSPNGGGITATFVLTTAQGAPSGSHDVVINWTSTTKIIGIAQAFSNVHQSSPATAKGGWYTQVLVAGQSLYLPPFYTTVSSATNHLVVGVMSLGNAYVTPGTLQTYAASGSPATEIASQGTGSGNPLAKMSTSPGAASLDMGWTFTPTQIGAGHGIYAQEYASVSDVVCNSGDATVTSASNPWASADVGATIVIEGAGASGAMLLTTIQSLNSAGSVEVALAPSTSISGARAKWAQGKLVKHNLIYDQFAYCMQMYGSSEAAWLKSNVTKNLFALRTVYLGGLSAYTLTDTVFQQNYSWNSGFNLGYHSTNLKQFSAPDNYIVGNCSPPAYAPVTDPTVTGGTFVGSNATFAADYPSNTYFQSPSKPSTNVVVVEGNDYKDAYDPKLGHVLVYNWENLTTVNVDLSSIVPSGTAIDIRNAQDRFNDAQIVYSGTYNGGTVSLPMTGLTAAAGIGYTADGPTGQGFNAFVVLEQGKVL